MCRGRWQPRRALAGVAVVAAVSPVWLVVVAAADVLPNSAAMWLPAHLIWFAAGMALVNKAQR